MGWYNSIFLLSLQLDFIYRAVEETNKNIEHIDAVDGQNGLQYKHCLNCGAELKGRYCHSCGQEAVGKTPTVKGFVMAYLDNAFLWDPQFFKTLWTLIRRPGHLTKEYNAGKFISQEHPLKLNMFLLFIFVTLFVFFASAEKMTDSVHNMTNDERVLSGIQLKLLMDDSEYVKKMQDSPRDTILLQAPLFLAENYPQILSNIETKEVAGDDQLDKWVADIPQVLIDDAIVVVGDDGYYRFNKEMEEANDELAMFNSVWAEMVRITSQYFPMLLLLTVPFLTFSLGLVQRKRKIPYINHFIFSLHYTAFLEFLMICVYLLYLTIAPSMRVLQFVMLISSCVYLAIAYRRVYVTTWSSAVVKSLLTSFIYCTILLFIFVAILLIACVIIATEML